MSNGIAKARKRNLRVERLHKLRRAVVEKELPAFLVSQRESIRYLSGFTGSTAWLLISERNAVLATDFRYTEQAKSECQDFEIAQIRGELHDWLPGLISDFGWRKLGFEASHVSYDSHHKLSEATGSKEANLELVPTTGMVEQLRSIKDAEELDLIVEAVGLADAVLEEAKTMLRVGTTEKEIAWEIEKSLRQRGSEGVPFEIIVASGANSALPHARPTDRAICTGEPVLIDMGARIGGYCSDLSRTLFLGGPNHPFGKIYDIVLKAQAAAVEGIRSGMGAAQADGLARNVIERAGYGDAFGHGLGHGVGLAVHESPRLGLKSLDSLADGMVFTVEPGIYLPGYGGVRIEDMVALENGRARVLTTAGK